MINKLTAFIRFWGIDRAIAYTLLSRGIASAAGPISLLLIANNLTPAEQGFYYTFGNILGLQIFFELGLSTVLLQFASHEKAKLEWAEDGTLTGDAIAKARLASLMQKAVKWYGVMCLLVIVTVLPLGFYFFSTHQPEQNVAWRLAWLWLVFASTGGLLLSPLYALVEGCGLVAKIASLHMIQNVIGYLLLWLGLSFGLKLYATPITGTVAFFVALTWFMTTRGNLLRDLRKQPTGEYAVDWRREVLPFQWKIAVSWLSGYFVFQLFNPIMFAYHGAAAAGQMGMSINIMTSISTLAIAWLTTKAAPFGSLVASGEYTKLDRVWFKSLWQSATLLGLGGIVYFGGTLYLQSINHRLGARLLPPLPLLLLIATAFINHFIFAEAIYLRAHKQDPFVAMSLSTGLLIGLSTFFLGKQFGAIGMIGGYFCVTATIGFGYGTYIFITKRREWHTATNVMPLDIEQKLSSEVR